MRAALDTNLLVYAEGFGDRPRVDASRALLQRLAKADLVIPLQCLAWAEGGQPPSSARGSPVAATGDDQQLMHHSPLRNQYWF
jgi:hypothetical protein